MDEPAATLPDPVLKEIGDVANALRIAQPSPKSEGAGAVFLIGAGCSVSAGIRHAAGVAQFCAVRLATKLSGREFSLQEPDVALGWLVEAKKVVLPRARVESSDGSHWGALYTYFFENHFQSANLQRSIINAVVAEGGDQLNWAHACLGELVNLGYVHTVLTTNFDQLVLQGIIRTGRMPVIADGLEALTRIVGRPGRPQVVHLHGSMHAYDLRNSVAAMAEPGRHKVAQSMVQTLMQECDLLVVVGYNGGEEGIMSLLRDTGAILSKLVIYWILYGRNTETLSPNARVLLQGENKYIVRGGSADRFFGQLMSEMELGQPEWVRDPVGLLKRQSELLIAPSEPQTEIAILVEAHKKRVEFADRKEHRPDEQTERKVDAAAARAMGNFKRAYEVLNDADRESDDEAARLHALNALSLCETEPDERLLAVAIAEFDDLRRRTAGLQQLENVLSLGQSLLLQSEWEAQVDSSLEAARTPLERIELVVEETLPSFPTSNFRLGNARLNLLRAQALQSQGEREPKDVGKLNAGRSAYDIAISGLQAAGEDGGLLVEAKAGLAALLQVLGEATRDLRLLEEAVQRHREVVDLSPRTERSAEDEGPISNLVGSLFALAAEQDLAGQLATYRQARAELQRLVVVQEQGDDATAADSTRVRLQEVDGKIFKAELARADVRISRDGEPRIEAIAPEPPSHVS